MYLNRILRFSITKRQQEIARNLYAHTLTLQKNIKRNNNNVKFTFSGIDSACEIRGKQVNLQIVNAIDE